MSNKTFCMNCGTQLPANSKKCTECGSYQDPYELDLSEDVIEARQEPQPPFEIPRDVYHNENWKRVKWSFFAPYAFFILYFILATPLISFDFPGNSIILGLLSVIWAAATLISFIAFAIYCSRDRKLLYQEFGHSKPRDVAVVLVFLFFFHVMYQLLYIIVRMSKYEIESKNEVSPN